VGPDVVVPDSIGVQEFLTAFLMLFWGAYIFLAVIGISDDWVRLGVAHACYVASAVCFLLGVCTTIGMLFFVMLTLVLMRFISMVTAATIAMMAAGVFSVVLFVMIVARNDKTAKQRS
jgi:O-antigen ligase